MATGRGSCFGFASSRSTRKHTNICTNCTVPPSYTCPVHTAGLKDAPPMDTPERFTDDMEDMHAWVADEMFGGGYVFMFGWVHFSMLS